MASAPVAGRGASLFPEQAINTSAADATAMVFMCRRYDGRERVVSAGGCKGTRMEKQGAATHKVGEHRETRGVRTEKRGDSLKAKVTKKP